jgi:hypothetical protein
MLRKIHGTNSFIENSCVVLTSNVKTDPVLPPAPVFYFNGQALLTLHYVGLLKE